MKLAEGKWELGTSNDLKNTYFCCLGSGSQWWGKSSYMQLPRSQCSELL